MEKLNNIVVIYGGSSSEREISLKSGRGIFDAINQLGFEAELIDYNDLDDFGFLKKYDLVFIALHGFEGEGGDFQKNLDYLGIRYTGSGPDACKSSWDKHICKSILRENDINTPSWKFHESINKYLDMPITSLDFNNVFLKPCRDGSSVDIFKIDNNKSFIDAVNQSINPNRSFITEELISGKEFTVTIIGNECFPAIEIVTENEFYDYQAKYSYNAKTEHIIPVDLPKKKFKFLMDTTLKVHNLMGCRGVTRSDFKYFKGKFYLLEINTQPGMTKLSLVPEISAYIGINFINLIKLILKDASINK